MLQGRFHWKSVAILLAGVAALGSGWFLIHRFQSRSINARFLEQAGRAESSNPPRYDRAVRFLRIYLLGKSDDVDARVRYGLLLEEKVPSVSKRHILDVYEHILDLDPSRDAIRLRAAKLCMQLGQIDNALAHLARLETRQTVDPEIYLLLGDCKAAKGAILKKQSTREARIELAKYWQEAEKFYREAILRTPKKLEAYARLAQLLKNEQQNPTATSRVLADLTSANPSDFHSYLIRCAFRQSGRDLILDLPAVTLSVFASASLPLACPGLSATAIVLGAKRERDMEGASEDLVMARKLAPDDVDVLLASSFQELLLSLGKGPNDRETHLDIARNYLKRASDQYPNDTRILPQQATIELAANQPKKAIEMLRTAQKNESDKKKRNKLLWDLAGLLIDQDSFYEAEEVIAAMKKNGEKAHFLDFMRARVALKQNKWTEAINFLEASRPLLLVEDPATASQATAYQADLLLGICFEQVGNVDQQLVVYQRAQKLDPFKMEPRFGVAKSLASLGRLDEAVIESQTLAGGDLLCARLMILRNLQIPPLEPVNWEDVSKILGGILERNPDIAAEVAILQAEVAFAEGISADTHAKINEAKGKSIEANAKFKLAKEKFAAADKILGAAKSKFPNNIEPWIAASVLAARKGGPDSDAQALAILKDAKSKFPDNVQWRLAMLRYLPPKQEDALSFLRPLAQNLENLDRPARAMLFKGLAEAYERAGGIIEAEKYWQDLVELEPNQLGVHLFTFDFYLRTEKLDGMAKSLASIVKIEGPDGPLGHFGTAQLLIYQAGRRTKNQSTDRPVYGGLNDEEKLQIADASKRLFAARAKRPRWSRIFIGLATVAELEGKTEASITYMREALDLGNRQVALFKVLVMKLMERNRIAEADSVLRKILEIDFSSDNYLQMKAAEVSLFNHNIDRALELTQRAVAVHSKDFQEHLWQGQMLALLGKKAEAEIALRTAIKLAGANSGPWVVLVQLEARGGNAKKAAELIEEMKTRIPASQVQLALAQCYQAIGQQDKAEQAFLEALKEQPNDLEVNKLILKSLVAFYQSLGKLKEAEQRLRQFLDSKLEPSDDAKVWGRRNLALALGLQEDAEKYNQAMFLIEENLKANSNSVDDQLAKGILLASRKQHHKDAIKILEGAFKLRQPTAHQMFVLANLYEAQDDKTKGWSQARSYLINLLTTHTNSDKYEVYLAAFISKLMQHDEFREAKVWIPRLQEAVKSNAADVKRFALATSLLTDLIRRHPSLAAEIVSENDAVLRSNARKHGDTNGLLVFADFLANSHRVDEALDLCEQLSKDIPPSPVIAVAVSAIFNNQATPNQFERVEKLLHAANKKAPERVIEWDMHLAVLKERRNQYAESEALYRSILKRSPNNVAAMNNLAFLIGVGSKSPEANDLIQRLIAKIGPVGEFLDTRAAILSAQGKFSDAEADMEKSLQENKTPYRLFHKAQIYYGKGKAEKAVDLLAQSHQYGLRIEMLHPLERANYQAMCQLKK